MPLTFQAPWQRCEKLLLASSRHPVRPPARPPALNNYALTAQLIVKFVTEDSYYYLSAQMNVA